MAGKLKGNIILNAAIICLMHTQKCISTCAFEKKVQFKLESIHTWVEDVLTFKVPYILFNQIN